MAPDWNPMDLESWDRHLEQMPGSPAVGRTSATVRDLREGFSAVWGSGLLRLNPKKGKVSYTSLILVLGLPREMPHPQSPTWAKGMKLI